MFGLRIGTEFLDLYPKTVIPGTMNNPIFDKESIARVFSYPFKLPVTAKNKRLLRQLDRLDSYSTDFDIDADLWISGMQFETGVIKVTNTTDKFFNIRFENKEQSFVSKLEKIKINEVLDAVSITYTPPTYAIFEIAPIGPYNLPINGHIFTASGVIDPIHIELMDAIHEFYPGIAEDSNATHIHIDLTEFPGMTIHYDIVDGLTLINGGGTYHEQKQVAFLEYVDGINNGELDTHRFPVTFNPDFYEDKNNAFQDYINYYNDGNFIENIREDSKVWKHTFVPYVRLTYVIERILSLAGIETISGEFYEIDDTQRLLIYNTKTLDSVTEIPFPGDTKKYFNNYKLNFSLNDHVPEMSGKELMVIFFEIFQLYPDQNGKEITIHKKREQLNNKPIDWTKKTTPGHSKAIVERIGFTLDYTKDEKDTTFISGQLDNFVIPPGEEPVELPFASLHHQVKNGPGNAFAWKVPVSNQPGNSTYSFRLIFDHGLQLDSQGNEYPLATFDYKNYAGETIGSYTLAINGDTGIYELCHKGIVELRQHDPITREIRLGIDDLIEIRKWKNPLRYIYDQSGSMVGIIKSVKFKATETGISESTVEFLKIK